MERLATKRQAYINAVMAKEENSDDLGDAIAESVLIIAQKKGYSIKK
ncbi:hypothetical protein [Massilibacteroides sp.]|nr:hypothetical protein [Massilibacteroides sp.]MDD4514283.1 hypothetical protein [Massilibacteroides sp.]